MRTLSLGMCAPGEDLVPATRVCEPALFLCSLNAATTSGTKSSEAICDSVLLKLLAVFLP